MFQAQMLTAVKQCWSKTVLMMTWVPFSNINIFSSPPSQEKRCSLDQQHVCFCPDTSKGTLLVALLPLSGSSSGPRTRRSSW